ncbi:MAG: tetratricopeptide repeat protein [Acidobacteria bacterium]|nr:tetratricopeptide repeat protein [Acidobacteriota bacterium]
MKQTDRHRSTRSRAHDARPAAPEGVICQVCGAINGEDQEYCRRCHNKLLVISGPQFEEDSVFEQLEDEGFSFDEHLLERISILEEVVKRSAESLRQLLEAVRKQERNVLINNTGLTALGELLEKGGVLEPEQWRDRWQNRMDEHLKALERRERFLVVKERILALYQGPRAKIFEDYLETAELALGAYQAAEAQRALESAFSLDPDNFELAQLLGEIVFDEGDSERALEIFEGVLERRPEQYDALVYAGAIHYQRGDTDRASTLLERAARVQPDAFLPQFSLGAVYATRRELERAVECLERAVEIDPVPQALFLLASCLYDLGRPGAAIRHLIEAVRIRPAFEEALQLLGLAYLDRGWYVKARMALGRAQRLTPKRLRYRDLVLYLASHLEEPLEELSAEGHRWYRKAIESLDRDDPEQAVSAYRRALVLEPENPQLLLSYALLCLQLDRGTEVEAVARRVLDLEPGELVKATAYAALIEALRGHGKYREGNALARRLLEEAGSDFARAIARYELAVNLADSDEDLDQALDHAQRAVELSPPELEHLPLAALGWIRFKRRELDAAAEALTRAAELSPSATTLQQLGLVMLDRRERREARDLFARARGLGRGDAQVEETMIECVRENRRKPEPTPPRPKK